MSDEYEIRDDLPIGEQVDEIGSELMATAITLLNKRRNGRSVSKEEESSLEDCQRLFKFIKSTYNDLVKMGRIDIKAGNEGNQFEKLMIQKIKEKKSSVGPIVKNLSKDHG